MSFRTAAVLAACVAPLVGVASCRGKTAPPPTASPASVPIAALAVPANRSAAKAFPALPDQTHLHNGHVVTSKILSGAQPEGEASFEALKDLGVKTMVSVDGAKPDVETARKYGLRYVHLPITYSGVKPEEGKALAKALDELPGPIYVHCHHGKHRSAAAVAVACVYNGMLAPEKAQSVLETFGTGANYKGLWQAARDARPLTPEELRELKVDYVEQKKIPAMAESMVLLDGRWDNLKAVQKAGWQAPADHPDLDPPHEALQLQEMFHEMRRLDSAHRGVPEFAQLLTEGEEGARQLRAALAAKPVDAPGAGRAFKRVAASCTACHASYRD